MSFVYDKAREAFLGVTSGSINWLTDVIKATLVSSSYVPDSANHQYVDPSLWAHTGSWTPQLLTGKTSTNGDAYASDITFSSIPVGSTIDYLAIYKESGNNSKSQWQLIALLNSGSLGGIPLTGSNAAVTINFNTGLYKIFRL